MKKGTGKANGRGAAALLRRTALSILVIIILIVAMVPANAGDLSSGVSNSSVSKYIVVFNDTPQAKTMVTQSASSVQATASNMVASYGGRVEYRYSIINGMEVSIPDDRADELWSLPNVKYVEKDQPVYAMLNQAVPQIGADQAWLEGYTGQGVKVAVIDSGIDAGHPDLNGGKVVAWADFVNGNNASPYDDHGHGTHCAGIIAGTGAASSGQYRGVAPNASLMGAKVLGSDGSGSSTNVIKGIEWAVQNHAQVISLSLGGNHFQAMDDAVTRAVNAGITVVAAAGNNGPVGGDPPIDPPNSIRCPGDNPNAITVGAVSKTDVIAGFSSRGPTSAGLAKPDVTNVGVSVRAPDAGTNGYVYMSGTSMATPMTAGVVALMLQKNSSLTPAQVKNILTTTAKPLMVNVTDPIPNYNYGWGRVQAKYAVDNVTASSTTLYGPRTVWSDIGKNGSITGRVTSSIGGTAGVAGAYVALINRTNQSQEFAHTLSDANGDYFFTGVNATYSSVLGQGPKGQGGQDYVNGTNYYQIYSNKSPLGSGNSAPFGINANITGPTTTAVVLYPPAPNMTQYGPRTVWSDLNIGGPVTGRVTTSISGTVGIASAHVALVNARNMSQEYCSTTSDANGNYDFTCVNASYSSILGQGPNGGTGSDYANGTSMYKIRAYRDQYGEAYSTAFGIDANNSGVVSTSVTILLIPVRIDLVAERPYINTNSSDNITITAYMFNILGSPVEDGYYINFTVGNATNNSFARNGYTWTAANGSLGSAGHNVSLNNPTQNNQGRASVQFGWVDPAYSGNNTTVWAYYENNPSVNASVRIYYDLQTFSYNLSKGWNMISVPLSLQNDSVEAFFPDSVRANVSDMWYYTNGTWVYYSGTQGYSSKYAHLTNVTPGKGYWVKLTNNSTFTINGLSLVNGVSTANSGWTMFGVGGLESLNATSTYAGNKDMWYYNNGQWYYYSDTMGYSPKYPHLDSLDPGKGYWVHY